MLIMNILKKTRRESAKIDSVDKLNEYKFN